jgi:hypothetical protein
VTAQRSAGLALLLLFLAAHLALLPRTLEDLDSINFALGVRDYDVARHQPHPPGYPVYIALSKASTVALRAAGVDAAAPRGLAIWSALAGTAAIPALLLFFRRLEGRDRLAWCATLIAAASPLFWFSALRPLSDMLGFAAVMWVFALVMVEREADRPGQAGWHSERRLVAAALLAGLAIGVRSQTALLTLPVLALGMARAPAVRPASALGDGRERRRARTALLALGAFAAGVVVWAVPMIVASGGPGAYLQALGSQAGEDFAGVTMLWTHLNPADPKGAARLIAAALANTFVWPWDWWPGVVLCGLAVVGSARLMWRAPRVALALVLAFGPYAVFHLLLQETQTIRYALPLVPVVAYAAMAALEGLPARALPAAAIGITVLALLTAVPASRVYAREGAPVFRVFDDMAATAHGTNRVDSIAMHAGARRAAEWAAPILPARVIRAPHGREWLALVTLWKAQPTARVWFAADPGRTDLALFDGHARQLARAYRWGFIAPPFVGGARPADIDWYEMQPPRWMLDRGWALTAEVGGITARDGTGPEAAPAVAWLARHPLDTTVVLGGRNLGARPVSLAVGIGGAPTASYELPPGFFLQRLALPAGSLGSGAGYAALEVRAAGGERVSLEQFDAQPPGVPMFGYDTGWHEPEFNPQTGRAWRWMSEKSSLWVRPVGRDVTLRLTGESPLRYYDAAPRLRVLVGDREVGAFEPSSDFERTFTLPGALLAGANGVVVVESSRFFVPGDAGGGGDQRRLALRIYGVAVE